MIKVLPLALLAFFPYHASAFPEMIRLGYVNCTACHLAPNGGGLMTDYGRSISAEALSTWARPKEELPGHDFFAEPPAWLKIGGGLRVIQTYIDTPRATASSFFLMQSDLELGLNFKKLWYVQSFGVQRGPPQAQDQGAFVSSHFYALYNWSDEIYSRAGKYRLPYGLNLPDHTAFVRQNLGLGQGQESYNLEAGLIGESWNSLLALSFGRTESRLELEKGASFQLAYNYGDSHKILTSLTYLEQEGSSSRILWGPQILWGFNPRWVFLGEYNYQEKKLKDQNPRVQKGLVTYSRLQFEWTRGVLPYLLHEVSYLDFTQLRTRVNNYGLGVLLYPRPHFEITAQGSYSETAEVNSYATFFWLLGHYYF